MFRTIIVPLDGTQAAEAAVPYAAEEAQHHGARLVLFQVVPQPELPPDHVVRGGPMPIVYVYPEEERDCIDSRVRRYLCSVVDRFRLGTNTMVSVDVGAPYLRLKAAIERYPDPLVVVSTGVPRRDHSSILPEVLEGLIREGLAPVLVVRGARPMRRFAEVPVSAGITHSLADQPLQWRDLVEVDAHVVGAN